MIKLGKFQDCVCIGRANPYDLCDGKLTFEEKGKKVTLKPKAGEKAMAIVFDGCVCTDNLSKCDGMFLYKKNNNRWIILVELKGSDLERAFEQLSYTKTQRQEYVELCNIFSGQQKYSLIEKSFIISNHVVQRAEHQKLENINQIRVSHILHSEATKPIPNLRDYL